jgi:hypothetical protein
MDRQEYLGFVAILESARSSVDAILYDISTDARGAMDSRLRQMLADLDKAIQAYREKSNA